MTLAWQDLEMVYTRLDLRTRSRLRVACVHPLSFPHDAAAEGRLSERIFIVDSGLRTTTAKCWALAKSIPGPPRDHLLRSLSPAQRGMFEYADDLEAGRLRPGGPLAYGTGTASWDAATVAQMCGTLAAMTPVQLDAWIAADGASCTLQPLMFTFCQKLEKIGPRRAVLLRHLVNMHNAVGQAFRDQLRSNVYLFP